MRKLQTTVEAIDSGIVLIDVGRRPAVAAYGLIVSIILATRYKGKRYQQKVQQLLHICLNYGKEKVRTNAYATTFERTFITINVVGII